MTRNKAGQNPPTGDSANVPIHEATPVTMDGPEGYSEDGSIRESEDDNTKAPYANSANTSNKSKATNYREQDTVMGSFGSGRWIITNLPRTNKGIRALKASQFGSPFAYSSYQNKHDFFKGLLAEGTCVLFDRVVAEASTLRERLSTGLTNDGRNGHFCFLEECESPSINSDSGEESNSEDPQLALYSFGPEVDRLELPLFVGPTSAAIHRTNDARENFVGSIHSSDSSSSTSILDVRRVRDSKTGETDYFVVNNDLDLLSINGIDVNPTEIAGPLPDFAVLEIGQFSIFWWRTAAALDYMPVRGSILCLLTTLSNADDLCRVSNENAILRSMTKNSLAKPSKAISVSPTTYEACKGCYGIRKLTLQDSSPNSQVFPNSKSWLDEYRRRFQLCEERPIKYTSSITDLHPPHQFPSREMHDTGVILAIGAVWLGLINAKVDFAYAVSDLFSVARSMRMVGMHTVKGPNHFIIPLLFNEELEALSPESEEDTAEPLEPVFSAFQRGEEEKNRENFAAAEKAKQKDPGDKNKAPLSLEDQKVQNQNYKGGIGHFVLAIAEKVNRDKPSIIKESLTKKALVRLRFMDSAEGNVDKGIIRRVARNIVRNSGWLGDTWPCFDANEEYWMEVLRQSRNRCGEHTVLNAWAYMLEIPLATTRKRALGPSSYDEVRRMIHLALRGQLDSLTIRAWMQHSGYAMDEPLSQLQQTQIQNPGLPNKTRNMQTVALNESAFNEIVNDMHTQEQAANQGHAATWGAVSVPLDGVTTQKPGHAPKVATRVTLPPSGQDLVVDSSGISGISASSTGPAKASPLPQASPPSSRTWQQSLARGLAYYKDLKAKNPRTTNDALKDASYIGAPSNMADYDVILGIAPIWEGLNRLRRADVEFTYAGMDVFSPGGGQQGIGAVGRWSRFIMPLFLSSTKAEALEDQGKGKAKIQRVGHLLLCVAELVNDNPMTIQIQIFDSRLGTVTIERILEKAKAVIYNSGWLGANRDGNWVMPVYRPCMLKETPQQVGINTCGLHVIFNAWAVMLGIPLNPKFLPRGRFNEYDYDAFVQSFLTRGLEIVNLALEGFMDSATIQAFFSFYGYSVEQRFGDPARSVIPFNAVGMNQDKFRLTLQRRHWTKLVAVARAIGVRYRDEDMAYLVGQGLSEDQAWRALSITHGNRTLAFNWHFTQEVPGELPNPEEALSPKTPARGEES